MSQNTNPEKEKSEPSNQKTKSEARDSSASSSGKAPPSESSELTSGADSYAEGTPLTWVLGNHPKVKIMAAMLSEWDRDLNVTEIARIGGVSRSSIYDHLDELKEQNIIEQRRKVSNSQMYTINMDSRAVRLIGELQQKLLAQQREANEPFDEEFRLDGESDTELRERVAASEEGGDEPYAEDTPLTWVFNNHPEPKIIAVFLSEWDRDINITDIARLAGVSRNTVYKVLDKLIAHDVIAEEREVGRSQMYKLNHRSKVVRALAELERELLRNWHESRNLNSEE